MLKQTQLKSIRNFFEGFKKGNDNFEKKELLF